LDDSHGRPMFTYRRRRSREIFNPAEYAFVFWDRRVVDRALGCSPSRVLAVRLPVKKNRLLSRLGPRPDHFQRPRWIPWIIRTRLRVSMLSLPLQARVFRFLPQMGPPLGGLPPGRLTIFEGGMWVLVRTTTLAHPHTVQTASPYALHTLFQCLYSAPQLLGHCPPSSEYAPRTPEFPPMPSRRLRRAIKTARDTKGSIAFLVA